MFSSGYTVCEVYEQKYTSDERRCSQTVEFSNEFVAAVNVCVLWTSKKSLWYSVWEFGLVWRRR